MKKLALSCLFLFIAHFLIAQTAPPGNLSGSDLRDWYKANWYDSKHLSLGYKDARIQMYGTIDNIGGKVTCVYTGYQQNGDNVSYLNPINAEHTVPQSFFNKSGIPRADIHHLYPTHQEANSARGSFPFAELTAANTNKWYYVNGNTYIPGVSAPANVDASSKLNTGSSFEPPEAHKGNLARSIFYFYTMYPTIAGSIGSVGDINTLYQWHLDDPVDDAERARNVAVETAQGNRNPYIDYPATVSLAWIFTAPTPSVQFKTATGTQTEGASANVTYSIEVEFLPAPTGTVTVEAQLDASGTNAQIADYSFSTQVLTFNASTTTQTVNVTVKNDSDTELDETVRLKLVNISSGDIGNNSTHTLTIKDNPPVIPTIQFSQASGTKQEGSGSDVIYTVPVTISPAPLANVTVDVQLDAGSTTAQATDYAFTNTTLTFSPSNTTQNVSVTVKSDNDGEANELVGLKLLNNVSGTALGSNTAHTLTIQDNPPANTPIISFDAATGTKQEDENNEVTYSGQLTISPAPAGTVTVQLVTDNNGTTAQSADYGFTSTLLTFSPSQTTQSFQVTVKADGGSNESDEQIKFILNALSGTASVGGNSTHILTIKDAEKTVTPSVSFAQVSSTIAENATTDLEYNVVVQISPVPATTYQVEVLIDADKTTATLNEDYAMTPVVLTFSPTKTMNNVPVRIKADTKVESDEQIYLKLANPSAGLNLGTNTTYTLIIKDATPTGLQNVQIPGIKIYPNVTDNYVNIDNTKGVQYQLEVYDMQGRFCMQKRVSTSTYQMSVAKLPAGWYFFQISNGKQHMVRRVAVMR